MVFLNLSNLLHQNPAGISDQLLISEEDQEQDFYRTNIHTHGLHISPYEDDVTVELFPGESKLYQFTVPHNHAGGLHWYHPHIEGISELTVGGGTLGTLEIVDDPYGMLTCLASCVLDQ